MSTIDNPFLDSDPSRLPCGILEHFVYSNDRIKLLNPTKEDDEKKYDSERDSSEINKSIFVIGDEEHTYYKMLQIQNEIEFYQQENKDDNKFKQLNNEMKQLIDNEEKKKKEAEKENRYYRTPQRLKIMKLRHYLLNFNILNK
eukprot:67060_1